MRRDLQRYLERGQPIEVIYLDRHGETSKRTLRLHSIEGSQVKAYCYTRRAFRVFAIDNILAALPATVRRAG